MGSTWEIYAWVLDKSKNDYRYDLLYAGEVWWRALWVAHTASKEYHHVKIEWRK